MSIPARTTPTATTRVTTTTTLHVASAPRRKNRWWLETKQTTTGNTKKAMRTLFCLLSLLFVGFLPAKADQVLRDGDVFRLAIGGAPREYTQDFELEYTINDGMVTIPIIGRMRAAGLSPNSL